MNRLIEKIYNYAGKKVKVLYDNKTVEVYYEHTRIALNIRKSSNKASAFSYQEEGIS